MPASTVKFYSSYLALIVECSNKAFNNMQMNKTVHNHNTDSTQCHQIAEMHYIPMRILPTAPLSLSWQHLCVCIMCAHTLPHTLPHIHTLVLPLLFMLQYVGIRSEYIKASTNMSHCRLSNTPRSSRSKMARRTQTHTCQGQIWS